MSHSGRDALRAPRAARGLTLIELVITMSLAGILAAMAPALFFHGVRSLAVLPLAQLATQVSTEILQAAVEGSPSALSGQRIPGLRSAARQRSPAEPAVWLAEDARIGFLVPHDPRLVTDNQYVVLRLDTGRIMRAVSPSRACPPPAASEEVVPYHAAGVVRVVVSVSRPLFRYYDANGTPLAPPGCTGGSAIRRVEIAFVAQAGPGTVNDPEARMDVMTSAAIRFP